jgi:hypothetical protein
MSVTTIKWVYNKTNELVLYQNHDKLSDWMVLPPRTLW